MQRYSRPIPGRCTPGWISVRARTLTSTERYRTTSSISSRIYEYQAAFADAWADVRARGCVPILCGGSGLYIESATRAYKFDAENGVPAERLPQKTFYIGTLVSREERVARIDRRLDERLEDGLIEEIQGLLDSGIPAEDLLWYGLEYKFGTALSISSLRSMFWGNSPTMRCTSSSRTPSISSPSAR